MTRSLIAFPVSTDKHVFDAEVVRIAFGIDPSYVPHVAVTIASIAAASPNAKFHFILMHSNVGEDDRGRVEGCATRAVFEWVNVDDPRLLSLTGRDHISVATFFRLALAKIVPEHVRRIIYLDSDLIVLQDITRLWHIDMQG